MSLKPRPILKLNHSLLLKEQVKSTQDSDYSIDVISLDVLSTAFEEDALRFNLYYPYTKTKVQELLESNPKQTFSLYFIGSESQFTNEKFEAALKEYQDVLLAPNLKYIDGPQNTILTAEALEILSPYSIKLIAQYMLFLDHNAMTYAAEELPVLPSQTEGESSEHYQYLLEHFLAYKTVYPDNIYFFCGDDTNLVPISLKFEQWPTIVSPLFSYEKKGMESLALIKQYLPQPRGIMLDASRYKFIWKLIKEFNSLYPADEYDPPEFG